MHRTPVLSVLALTLSLAPACIAVDAENLRAAEAIDARYRSERRAFEAEQNRLRRSPEREQVVDLGATGMLHIRDVELIGWPSAAYLRVEYTYLNTTGAERSAPNVRLVLEDPTTGEDSWVEEQGVLPLGFRLGVDSTYSSWIEAPTHGLQEREGWTWRLEIE